MRAHITRSSALQMFSGAHANQRFGRDDAMGDFILRERDLHSHIPVPMRLTHDDEPIDALPPNDSDDDREDGRDDLFPRPKTLNYGY